MKIILLKEVKGLGRAGEIMETSEGYAMNFLIPRGLADTVTRHGVNTLEAQKRKRERLERERKTKKAKLARKVAGKVFTIEASADAKGTLYAGLDAKAIAGELKKQNIDIEPNEINLENAIKKIGKYDIDLQLAGERAKILLIVDKRS